MTRELKDGRGLFAGADTAIHRALNLASATHHGQKSAWRFVAGNPLPQKVLIALVGELFELVQGNLRERPASPRNWRWTLQTYIAGANKSPEVIIERSIAILAARGALSGLWCNQIPVASGLVDHRSDKRAAVDLARLKDGRLDLFELKWASDTPIYAALEMLLYGIAYLLCRLNRTKLGYEELETMRAEALGLNVLAPPAFYEGLNVSWLVAGLDVGFRQLSQELLGPEFQTTFRMLSLPLGPAKPFATGAEAIAACTANPLGQSAMLLIDALGAMVDHGAA